MRALVAFDKFKDSMSAQEACAVASRSVRSARPHWSIEICPLADGSDGFANILTQYRKGELFYATVNGPMFKPVEAQFGLVDCSHFSMSSKAWLGLPDSGKVAIVEMAQTSGLAQLSDAERNLWYTSSYGLGELLKIVFGLNPCLVIVGLGGSATHDLGLGALEALGMRYRAETGELLEHITPQSFSRVVALEGSVPKAPRMILAPNVGCKLLGRKGAASLFGPQKGLKQSDYQRLESQTQRIAEFLMGHFNAPSDIIEKKGSGAAGGMAVGLQAAFKNVEIWSGVELADRWLRLSERIERANVVFTGEGTFDEGSMEGKVPQHVINKASNHGKRIYCMVGQYLHDPSVPTPESLAEANIVEIAPQNTSKEESIKNAVRYLGDSVSSIVESL